MKPLITALIDTYNQERYIEQALVSVVEQGLSSFELEIVVVDDGSTDRTPLIVQKFVPRVKLLRKKNGGQASAFNAAFPEVNGRVIALLDGDDWWAKSKLTTVLETFERNPEMSAVGHAYYRFYEKTKEAEICGPSDATRVNLSTPEAARLACRDWVFFSPSALVVRRVVLERVMPIPEALVFLGDSPIAVASMAMGTLILPKPLSYYRIHSSNLYARTLEDPAKLRRRCEMDDIMFSHVEPILLRLGVSEECVSEFIDAQWVYINRLSLRTFGGRRLKTFRTEMRSFRSFYKNPSLAFAFYKYAAVGSATLLLPPRLFYRIQDWYVRNRLHRFRDWIFKLPHGSTN